MTRIIDLTAQGRRIDPAGCRCTDCLTGESVPRDFIPVPQAGDVILVGYSRPMDLARITVHHDGTWSPIKEGWYQIPMYMRFEDLHPHVINFLSGKL